MATAFILLSAELGKGAHVETSLLDIDEVRAQFGNIPEIIVKTAKEENFDLIIMGHKGLTGIKHAMMGSVAERVCHIAPCPVLIIR